MTYTIHTDTVKQDCNKWTASYKSKLVLKGIDLNQLTDNLIYMTSYLYTQHCNDRETIIIVRHFWQPYDCLSVRVYVCLYVCLTVSIEIYVSNSTYRTQVDTYINYNYISMTWWWFTHLVYHLGDTLAPPPPSPRTRWHRYNIQGWDTSLTSIVSQVEIKRYKDTNRCSSSSIVNEVLSLSLWPTCNTIISLLGTLLGSRLRERGGEYMQGSVRQGIAPSDMGGGF